MVYLFFQTWLWILGAGLLGLLIGWLIWGKRNARESADAVRLKRQLNECRKRCAEWEAYAGADKSEGVVSTESISNAAAAPATAIADSGSVADDLKRVKGIGPVIEKTLNELGIFHFRQVGAFTEENIRWVDNYIAFPGRIQRENWVSQAQQLDGGGETDFSNRYDKK